MGAKLNVCLILNKRLISYAMIFFVKLLPAVWAKYELARPACRTGGMAILQKKHVISQQELY